MCGIAGFTGPPKSELLRNMCAGIQHRGPDDEGTYETSDISLGIRRLEILDLDTGQQPISNEKEDVWVVFNGEIYNHRAIRQDLIDAGHYFRTSHSDTEIIVHAYEEYGVDWPEKIQANGMFSIALWDARYKKLILYRDRMGKKPLYYAYVKGGIVFASEIKSLLLHPDISRELDHHALAQYFMLKHVRAPATAYVQIRQLLPGHLLVWEPGREVKIKSYWSLFFASCQGKINEEEAANRISSLIKDAVALRMDCDVPYGAYLSGGLDSTAVTALMCRMQTKPIKTFCLGYTDNAIGQFAGKAQDLYYARMMAQRLGTEHHELIISAQQFAADMPKIMSAFDEPFSGTISTWFLSTLIENHVKVALSGDGADELFGSYLAHRLAFPLDYWLFLQQQGKTERSDLSIEDMARLKPFDNKEGLRFLNTLAFSDQAQWRESLGVFSPDELEKLLTAEFLDQSVRVTVANCWPSLTQGLSASDVLNQSLEVDQRDLLSNQILPFVDRLSMAHSIEVRCPYLDHRIVALANSLPGGMKIKNGVTKHILKKSLEGLLPDDLLHRPKEGFVQPIYAWMHGSLRQWTLDRLAELPADIVRSDYVAQLGKHLTDGDSSVNAKVWNLVCFSIWHGQTTGR
jgi:asparagine synthase (glutamine-hydrolysing)